MPSGMKDVRRDFGGITEEDGEVHDIVEGVVALCTLERSSRVLGNDQVAVRNGHGDRCGAENGNALTIIS